MDHMLEWLAVAIVTILAVARLTRLLIYDDFPPTAWFRDKWDGWTHGSKWNEIMHCAFCASFYVSLVVVGAGVASGFAPWWWVVCSVLSASYVAAMIVASDWG